MILPAAISPESRSEFWRYAGQTFMFCIKAGLTPEQARGFTMEYVSELATRYVKQLNGTSAQFGQTLPGSVT